MDQQQKLTTEDNSNPISPDDNNLQSKTQPQTPSQSSWYTNWWNRNNADITSHPNDRVTNETPIENSDENTNANENTNASTNTNIISTEHSVTLPPGGDSWYGYAWNKLPQIPYLKSNPQPVLELDDDTTYQDLNETQKDLIKREILESITQKNDSWCWYKEMKIDSDIPNSDSSFNNEGFINAFNTSSMKWPIPYDQYPLGPQNQNIHHIGIHNSIILPSQTPLETLHTQPLKTKIVTTVKEHYNFENETHLYLKKNLEGKLFEKNVVILSCTGYLPKNYEKYSIEHQPTSFELTTNLSKNLLNEHPKNIHTISLHCPLHIKSLDENLDEVIEILKHWKHLFKEADVILFMGVYHSSPLLILIIHHILKTKSNFQISSNIPVGILLFESCLQGYRFWDHNTDLLTYSHDNNYLKKKNSSTNIKSLSNDYNKILQTREKELFQNTTKLEKDTLLKLRNYRKVDSKESKKVQSALSKILNNWPTSRLTFFGKLYDNFMTISQKLAVDYTHPQIFRNIWCDAKYMGVDLKSPLESGLNDEPMEDDNLTYETILPIPNNRLMEIVIINNFLLALNLGYYKFIPIFKLLSPFFISRSFNSNTVPSTLQKKLQNQLKSWLQEMDSFWKGQEEIPRRIIDNIQFPETLLSLYPILQYLYYKYHINKRDNPNSNVINNTISPKININTTNNTTIISHTKLSTTTTTTNNKNKNNDISSSSITNTENNNKNDNLNPTTLSSEKILKEENLFVLETDMYTDDSVYQCFIQNTLSTKSPLNKKQLHLLNDHSTPKSILNETNQYDLVWKFHEALSLYMRINNLPHQEFPLHLSFALTAKDTTFWKISKPDPTNFINDNSEAITRVKQTWEVYQHWDPPTRGLKQLKRILSVLEFYDDAESLIEDVKNP
ncbi:hypothetical protein TBLA_0B07340 [Henningerozyma blattae CBS 6284]|uniref:Uncharacterized protein n=1 Tax=Henningerozyma blattae (strain ATCC 34711 / CBS 6284 / DSM 70876 / NBRC 10599 / NRRL Y-10934 / UCD 77-7) TaxID=1071380 RepID=I2GZK0_HENB6|nr:hypothetical protein TBLA_0B07340 [Tetrapisispora blattae CBS 6284]CCH59552.1 hypothetical protein TBLA_0B07340 [Tetrapisispora blattae CBS 6284]